MASKRGGDASTAMVAVPSSKRAKNEIVAANGGRSQAIIASGPPRTSNLMAPVMELVGHAEAIHACTFSPSGNMLATAGFDREIYLWRTFGECENSMALKGHAGSISDIAWTACENKIYSCSTDKTVAIWDGDTGERLRKLKGHASFINSCSAPNEESPLIVTGSDDCTIKIWDARRRGYVHSLSSAYQVTAATFGMTTDEVISGGLDNDIKIWDVRKLDVKHNLRSHTDTITGIALSGDGKSLASNSMDNTVKIWDVQPFVSGDRLKMTLTGVQHNFEKNLHRVAWAPDNKHVAAGSADRNVYVWDTLAQRVKYCLPGHKGAVNDVAFHPKEPILLSCSSDKKAFLGELQL
eukprot:TRINITY_DN7408_c0_g1_i2.p1 TRINITY_DN7408_c0_g1~~TRINITY_DN7408_c0_g1_i2.p1  ORF type:complete len:352 (+),score=52.45 TRINITY_DN7408_c0_g1_i2:35-1090(+)